jgi:hypothetical protein
VVAAGEVFEGETQNIILAAADADMDEVPCGFEPAALLGAFGVAVQVVF